MSPLARSLLGLAAAALLHGACADSQCTTVVEGSIGIWGITVSKIHLIQEDIVIDLPSDLQQCAAVGMVHVGMAVRACDPFGAAPRGQLLDDGRRVRVVCTWSDGQQCPEGVNVSIQERCAFSN